MEEVLLNGAKTLVGLAAGVVVAELTAIGMNAAFDDAGVVYNEIRNRMAPPPPPKKKWFKFGKKGGR